MDEKIKVLLYMCEHEEFDPVQAESLLGQVDVNALFLHPDGGGETTLLNAAAMHLNLKMAKILLQKGADPNAVVGDQSVFETMDDHVVLGAMHFEIQGRDQVSYEKEFRIWLLMMAYGGHLQNGQEALAMKNGYSVDIFKDCENFSFCKRVAGGEWHLHIYFTSTKEEVAALSY